jgi:hypothetical protein
MKLTESGLRQFFYKISASFFSALFLINGLFSKLFFIRLSPWLDALPLPHPAV